MQIIYPLIIAHLLGDYYFQTDELAQKKNNDIRQLLIHSLIYLITMITCLILFYNIVFVLSISLGISLSHLLIDFITINVRKKYLNEQNASKYNRYIYLADQILHLIVIAATVGVCVLLGSSADGIFGQQFMYYSYSILPFLSCLLFIGKPSNVTIKCLIAPYKPNETDLSDDKNAGGFIGILERLLMLLLLFIGQYIAIGLILTAKSIVRYKRISESRAFGEYFLSGTLLSVILVVIPVLLINYLNY